MVRHTKSASGVVLRTWNYLGILSIITDANTQGASLWRLEVIGLVSFLPFDIAAQAGELVRDLRRIAEDGFQRGDEILASDRFSIFWTAAVELSSINQVMMAVEEEKVGGAGGAIGLSHGL